MSKAHRDYFNRLAPEWNGRMGDDPGFQGWVARFGVSSGECVLDVGAGTGRMTKHLAEQVGRAGTVVAVDVAEKMLSEARRLLGSRPPYWVCGDVDSLSFRPGVFDKVLCFSAFPHFVSPQTALEEMRRVLKKQGRLLILHASSSQQMNAFHASLDGIVRHDRLPGLSEMVSMLERTCFELVEGVDREDLYWVEAIRAD